MSQEMEIPYLYIADDNPNSPGLFEVAVDNDNLGKLLRWRDTRAIGMIEGVVSLNNNLYATARGKHARIFQLNSDSLKQESLIEKITFKDFGNQINGIGADPKRNKLFATLSSNRETTSAKSNTSAFFEIGPNLKEISRLWHLGPFAVEPRAIAVRDGLVYILDQDDFPTGSEGQIKRRNLSVLVFSLDLDAGPDELITFLPRRDGNT